MLYKEIHRGVRYLELTYYVFQINFLIIVFMHTSFKTGEIKSQKVKTKILIHRLPYRQS